MRDIFFHGSKHFCGVMVGFFRNKKFKYKKGTDTNNRTIILMKQMFMMK